MKNVLTLTPNLYGISPGQRSSVELWERVLLPSGIRLHYAPFETPALQRVLYRRGYVWTKSTEMLKGFVRRAKLLREVDDFDAVLVYREAALLGPAWIERYVVKRGLPLIYQLDDPLYLPYVSPSNSYLSYLKIFRKVADICRMATVVVVNSRPIAEYAAQFNTNVRIIPSLFDEAVYYPVARPANTPPRVGWSGSVTTVPNLRMLQPVFERLLRETEFSLRIVGAGTAPLENVPHETVPWSAESEIESLRGIDIGVVPLPNNEWNRRKFILKLVQYMALGIPAVCTPLGSNPYVVRHGETGFLAQTQEEWIKYLRLLIEDDELRRKMGAAAAREAREKYSLAANRRPILSVFEEALRTQLEPASRA